ncbi:cob(I)yrinic acid a,c-diamide adenosyltransferase [Selenomonas sp.]|uniref:cob(I)yrinic acid a,c-diamide adenosyltransferase n=1 Tax=Selenomonas sp. TaxID=2053611 RepID=UPI003FA2DE4D
MMEKKGLILVHTGDGKGKTTAAIGLAVRAWGDGFRILILQFIKGSWKYGELTALKALAEADGRIEIRPMGIGFTRNASLEEMIEHRKKAQAALQEAVSEIKSGRWDMVILDEINYALKFGLLEEQEVLTALSQKPAALHLVLTGRDALPAVIECADLVTEMRLVKHPFEQGIRAQKGIEF